LAYCSFNSSKILCFLNGIAAKSFLQFSAAVENCKKIAAYSPTDIDLTTGTAFQNNYIKKKNYFFNANKNQITY